MNITDVLIYCAPDFERISFLLLAIGFGLLWHYGFIPNLSPKRGEDGDNW